MPRPRSWTRPSRRPQEAQATIDKVQKARAFCERDLPARARETERLRTALTQAESYQNDLEREFARSSWQAVARNLDQARSLLATFDRQAEQAAAAATTTRQEYVRGAALVEELARQQQIVLRLMSGLGEQLNALVNVRNECRKLNEDLAARERQAELLIRQNDADRERRGTQQPRIGARGPRRRSSRVSGEPAPDWPALRQSLTEVIEDLSIAQSQAEEDIKNHQALTQEFEQVRNTASRVYAFSEQSSGRPPGGEPALPGRRRRARPGRDGAGRAARPIGRVARTGARGGGRPGPLRRAGPRRHPAGRPGPGPDQPRQARPSARPAVIPPWASGSTRRPPSRR